MGLFILMALLPLLFLGFAFSGDHQDDAPEDPDQRLEGTGDDDMLQGGSGNDTLLGFEGEDTLSGAGGNDALWADEGNDGSVQDVEGMTDAEIEALIFGGDTAALQAFVDDYTTFGADGGAGSDHVNGGSGNDVLTGGAGNDMVRGSSGHDLLIDLAGANTLHGGFGNDDLWGFDPAGTDAPDLLQGWNGDDNLLGDDGDTMEGGEGADNFYTVWRPGDAPVTITDFDPVTEFLQINTSDLPDAPVLQLVDLAENAGVAVTLNGETLAVLQGVTATQFHAEGEVAGNIRLVDRVGGEAYAPELAGPGNTNSSIGQDADYIGSPANDRIVAADSDDYIKSGDGDDTLFGGAGRDYFSAGSGNDEIFAGAGADRVDGGRGNDLIRGGTGSDYLHGGQYEGADGNDTIYGDAGDDELVASSGFDALFGGSGNDSLYSGYHDGADTLDGGEGDDSLHGTAGTLMTGGAGADQFHSGIDMADTETTTITDFTPGEDSILIQIYGNEVTPGFVVQAQGSADSVILVDGIQRVVLLGVTPAQVDTAAIYVSHIN